MVNQLTFRDREWTHTLVFPDHMVAVIPTPNPNKSAEDEDKRDIAPVRFLSYQDRNLNKKYK